MSTTPPSGLFDSLFSPSFQTWLRDFRQSAKEHSSSLTLEGYLRLIIIVGAYCMIRPYLVKLGGRFQAKDHERDVLDDESGEVNSPAVFSPNMLRGRPDVVDDYGGGEEDEDEDSGEEEGETVRWGRGARRRQRRMIVARKEEEENLKVKEEEGTLSGEEADSDREIEEFLRKVIN